MAERKPPIQHKVDIGLKLYHALKKKADAAGETIELYASKALWAKVQR